MKNSFPASLSEQIGRGGFATVFRDPRNPLQTCIKKFNTPTTSDRASLLIYLSEFSYWSRPSDAQLLQETFSWPLELFGTADEIWGYTMPLAPEDAYIELRAAGRTNRRLLEMSFLTVKDYFNRAAISSDAPEFSMQDRIELSIAICDAFQVLHSYGFVYRDVSARNLAARMSEPRRVFVLDADSILEVEAAKSDFIVSPGWQVDSNFDPLQADRAKLALLVLRLLIQDNDARPPTGFDVLEREGRRALAVAIQETYTTGTDQAFNDMTSSLRRARSSDRNRKAWNAAIASGFARAIVREGSAASSPSDHHLLQQAQRHVALENQIESSDLKTQRKLLAKLSLGSNFLVDTLPTVGTTPPPKSVDELIQLAYDAQFVEIATHLSRLGLSTLEDHSLLPSLADRAVFEADRPTLESVTAPGSATLKLHWPHARFCNALEVSIRTDSGIPTTEIIHRDQLSAPIERIARLPKGGHVQVQIRTGIQSPSGKAFFTSRSLISEKIQIEPLPTPSPRPLSQRNTVDNQLLLIDPDEEERERLALQLARKKRKRKRILISCIAVVLLGSSYVTWQLFADDAQSPPTSPFGDIRY